jgi:DoxX-like protein
MNSADANMSAKGSPWPGRIFTGVAALMTLGSATAKLLGAPAVVNGLVHAGFPRTTIVPIAILELTCTFLFLFPRTAGLGVLLLTGFFGGATVTHIVGHENFAAPLIAGLMVWAAAYFRLPEFGKLLPLGGGRRRAESYGSAGGRQPLPSRS